MSDQMTQDIKTIYDEICKSHDGIAEFRAKLLGLLPLASGVGIFLVVGSDALTQKNVVAHLIAVGLFGILITSGLFLYELRGIQKCNAFIKSAQELEKQLLPGNNLWKYGAFNFRQKSFRGIVGATGAALVIYPTVIGSWGYILAVGLYGSSVLNTGGSVLALLFAVLCLVLALLLGYKVNKENRTKLDQEKSRVSRESEKAK